MPTSAHPVEVGVFRLPAERPARRLADPRRVGRPPGPAPARSLVVATPGLVRRAHAAGKHVHVWTIDDPDEMRELLDRGVDGLITDRTDILRDVLDRARPVEG